MISPGDIQPRRLKAEMLPGNSHAAESGAFKASSDPHDFR
jgi:hypothetical protein